MPQIESHIVMNAPREMVWALAQDVENLPQIMPDLEAVKILEREEQGGGTLRTVTEGHGRIKQMNRKIDWVEEDIWNRADWSCRFWQMRGDFDEYSGNYSFVEQDGATSVSLKVEYAFNVPLLGALMQKVIQKIMQDNSDNMLKSLKAESERRAAQA